MGKNEFLTPKAIANRIKAKGLQKLRWYCQMCQKQCRDENGFKCHCMSEGHQRQMQVFGQNPDRIVGGFSEEFERAFLDLMRRSHRFSRVAATVVYNEYIADRHHVHMNSTQWATLTEFVKYLGRTGQCKVEDTPRAGSSPTSTATPRPSSRTASRPSATRPTWPTRSARSASSPTRSSAPSPPSLPRPL
uniref:DNA/RNA-binding protein Kin17 WH-like domain-containing protein n=1 Tax=Ananas comosus var. bracteatus TaxID=296719 RepID=A0A6V7NEU7_ANACO|nr:unnamed protein product [Ananas comosus var. bracteatus]